VRHAGSAGKLFIVVFFVGLMYAGYRLDVARHEADLYKKEFGYRTPTVGLPNRVFQSRAWQGWLIDSAIAFTDGAHNLEPFDIDGDNDLELIADSFRSDKLMMYDPVQDSHNPQHWARCVIDSRVGGGFTRCPVSVYAKSWLKKMLTEKYIAGGVHYTAISDLNGDGKADLLVAGDEMRNDVVWYERVDTTGGKPLSWLKHVAYRNDSHRTYHVEAGDIDGDGDQDIVFTTKTENSLGWLENRRMPGAWPVTMVDSNCTRCFYARVADVDRDGRGEIFASRDDSQGAGGRLHLYRHTGNPKSVNDWRRYDLTRCPSGCGVSVFVLKDMDGDGNLDVAAASIQGDVLVLRNPYPDDVFRRWDTWFVRKGFTNRARDFREIDVGDIDLDGDQDIVVADEMRNAVLWFENPGETFCGGWKEHVVDQSSRYLRWCHSVRLGDIDNDGDLDIAVAAAASNVFLLYLNQAISNGGTAVAGVPSNAGENK